MTARGAPLKPDRSTLKPLEARILELLEGGPGRRLSAARIQAALGRASTRFAVQAALLELQRRGLVAFTAGIYWELLQPPAAPESSREPQGDGQGPRVSSPGPIRLLGIRPGRKRREVDPLRGVRELTSPGPVAQGRPAHRPAAQRTGQGEATRDRPQAGPAKPPAAPPRETAAPDPPKRKLSQRSGRARDQAERPVHARTTAPAPPPWIKIEPKLPPPPPKAVGPAPPLIEEPGFITYPRHSTFVGAILDGLQKGRHRLGRGEVVSLRLEAEKAGLPGHVEVTIDQTRTDGFRSDWRGTDPTLFPARLRAAAWALYRIGLAGKFALSHEAGVLAVRWLDHPPVIDLGPGAPPEAAPKPPAGEPTVLAGKEQATPTPPPASEKAGPGRAEEPSPQDGLSRRLQSSPVWEQRVHYLPPRLDRERLYRLVDALATTPSMHEQELAPLLDLPRRRLPGFLAQVQTGLNVSGESVLTYDRESGSVVLNVTLLEQCFELARGG